MSTNDENQITLFSESQRFGLDFVNTMSVERADRMQNHLIQFGRSMVTMIVGVLLVMFTGHTLNIAMPVLVIVFLLSVFGFGVMNHESRNPKTRLTADQRLIKLWWMRFWAGFCVTAVILYPILKFINGEPVRAEGVLNSLIFISALGVLLFMYAALWSARRKLEL